MTHNRSRILIVHDESTDVDEIRRFLEEDGDRFFVQIAGSFFASLDAIYNDPPDLLIVNQSLETDAWKDLCSMIKQDIVFGHLPILLILQPLEQDFELDWEKIPVDDYLREPLNPEEIRSRVLLALARADRNRDANPLTRLPGNHSIMKEIQKRIKGGSHFAIGYVDLDEFKSYNDKYGFVRGDEIIKMTARIVTNSVRKLALPDAFTGHIGGDDFVFIVPPDRLDSVSREIIKNFDLIVSSFYDEDDRIRGYIESTNRKGEKERFPIMSISIAAVTTEYRPIKHIGQISAIMAEVKKRVKSMKGSNYLRDLRGSKKRV